MQKIGQLDAFVRLTEKEDASFKHPAGMEDQSRLIKFRVLSENPVQLFLRSLVDDEGQETDKGEVRFLTYCDPGLDQVEFYYKGPFALQVKGGTIWLDTFDNTSFDIGEMNDVSFARLWEREERDPVILEIERQARHNQLRLQEEMRADMARYRAELEERYGNRVNPPESHGDDAEQPEILEGGTVPPAGGEDDDQSAETGTGGNA